MRIRCPALSVNLLLIDWPTATVHAGKPKATPPNDEETEPSKRRSHHGMPKAQVHKWGDEPDDIHVTSRAETWSYFFGRAIVLSHLTSRNRVWAPSISNEAGILTGFEDNEQD